MINFISFSGGGCRILYTDGRYEDRAIKNVETVFRKRLLADCEGIDFWNITNEEEELIIENTFVE